MQHFTFCIVSFDLEATSKDPKEDEITQVGFASCLLSIEGKTKGTSFTELVKCNKKIDPKSSEITGITNEMLADKEPLPSVLTRVADYFHSLPEGIERVLMAYNGKKFDLPLLVHDIRRQGLNALDIIRPWRINWFFDPLPLAKHVLDTTKLKLNEQGLPDYRLGSVYECLFGKELQNAHSALFDAEALLQLVTDVDVMKNAVLEDMRKPNPEYAKNILTLVQEIPMTQSKKRKQAPTFVSPPLYKRAKKIEWIVDKVPFDLIIQGLQHLRAKDKILVAGEQIQFRCGNKQVIKTVTHTLDGEIFFE